jgi:hypothetical protein
MAVPKRKNDISVYTGNQLVDRRQELLDRITKSDTNLPESIMHDDLDLGMLDFVKNNFKVISNGEQVSVIPKILTIQRWGEFTNTWDFADLDGNAKLPFIGVIRRPDVQPGTNPITQRTIPDRRTFYYASVPTWDGTQMGADVYKIPQPTAIDISYDVTIVCTQFRDLNKFNKTVLQKFSSRQAYTTVKGHYIPIILDSIEDNSPVELDTRRFYIQNYKFTLLGFIIDDEEFEVKPAVSRLFLMNEFMTDKGVEKKYINKDIDLTVAKFSSDGNQTQFSVGESIGILFNVMINGVIQERDLDFYHVSGTSKISFPRPPAENDQIVVTYYKGRNSVFIDNFGKPIQVVKEYFTYDGSTLDFTVQNAINSVVTFDVNGLTYDENSGVWQKISDTTLRITDEMFIGATIGINYLY